MAVAAEHTVVLAGNTEAAGQARIGFAADTATAPTVSIGCMVTGLGSASLEYEFAPTRYMGWPMV